MMYLMILFGGLTYNATGTANAAGDVAISTRGATAGDGLYF